MSSPELLVLAKEERAFFDENGYIGLRSCYTESEVEEMRRELHDLMTNTDGRPGNISYDFFPPLEGYPPDPLNPKNCRGMMDHVLANDFWFDHFTDPRIVSVMVDLLGPNVDFHNGKIRNKPPGFRCEQGWHQDFPYERHSRPELAAAITYLDDTAFEAGATEVVPGSHLAGELPTRDGFTLDEGALDTSNRVVFEAKAGDVLIIHVLVVHRAGHNFTHTARHAIINEYKAMEAVDQWNNRCAFAGLPLARGRRLLMPRVMAFS